MIVLMRVLTQVAIILMGGQCSLLLLCTSSRGLTLVMAGAHREGGAQGCEDPHLYPGGRAPLDIMLPLMLQSSVVIVTVVAGSHRNIHTDSSSH